ncbi:hypothetical protein [Nocardioides sp. KR10-350]|uniref:hypothetical protein n=1 Tax=Nocardioides cheoyonin TaxID=3156615 RepID=UPI0032B370CF
MTAERAWARHFMDEWQARAGDPRLPYWLRIASLAYGHHENNGHAKFKRGEIALILAKVDGETGEIRPHQWVGRDIALAVEYGWLSEGSFWGCLIVPAHSVRKGDMWATPKPCPIHMRRKAKRAKSSITEDFAPLKPAITEGSSARKPHSLRTSERKPLSLICSTEASASDHPDHKEGA